MLAASNFVSSPLFGRRRESAAALQRSILVAAGPFAAKAVDGDAHVRDGQVRGRGIAGGRRFRGGRRDAGRGGVARRETGSGPVVVRGGGAESNGECFLAWTHGSSFLNWTRGCSWVTLSLTSCEVLALLL
jgi:hypothetical protein